MHFMYHCSTAKHAMASRLQQGKTANEMLPGCSPQCTAIYSNSRGYGAVQRQSRMPITHQSANDQCKKKTGALTHGSTLT